jgi:hypothetical protein
MISAFGTSAAAFAARIDGEIDAIVSDVGSLGKAYLEAVRRRVQGERFYGMVLFEDQRANVVARVATMIVAQNDDPDQRDLQLRLLFEGKLQVNGTPVVEQWGDSPEMRALVREFYSLCDAVLVRSFAEYGWVQTLSTERPPPRMARVVSVPSLPDVARSRPVTPGIVIWAPLRSADLLALHVAALADAHAEITCVVAGGALPPRLPAVTVMTVDDPRLPEVLARASCVVCAETNDPGDAIAFAQRGYGVVAPLTSGAHEYLSGVALWDGLFYYQLYVAVLAALGQPAAVAALPPVPPPLELPPMPVPAGELPLVSIIMPTYNRRDMLARALEGVAAQRYPRVELVVVNDAGASVDDLVTPYSQVRLIVHETNRGANAAFETGFNAATGEYVMFLPDDDWIYPDHLERLVAAVLRSGAGFAHSSMLLRYLETLPDGAERVAGFNASTFSRTANLTEVLLASPVSINQCLIHRRCIERIGLFVNDSAVADNEYLIRLLQHYTPAFVPQMTCEFRDHQRGNLGRSNDLGPALAHMYEQLHPQPHRPLLNAGRQEALANVARRVPGASPFPPTIAFVQTPGVNQPP